MCETLRLQRIQHPGQRSRHFSRSQYFFFIKYKIAATMVTRSVTDIPLIGQPRQNLSRDILPTTLDVLRTYFYHHRVEGLTLKDSLKTVTLELLSIWSEVDVVVSAEKNVIRRLRTLLTTYKNLGRSRKRGGETHAQHEASFIKSISGLFDISQPNAFSLMTDDNDKVFLADQPTNRRYNLKQLKKFRDNEEQRRTKEFIRAKENLLKNRRTERIEPEEAETMDALAMIFFQMSSDEELSSQRNPVERQDSTHSIEAEYEKQLKRAKTDAVNNKVVSEEISTALDRANISNVQAVHILAADIATCSDTCLEDTSRSVSTVRRMRNLHRSKVAVERENVF